MNRVFTRRTLANPLTLEGKGLHSGGSVSVQLLPSENGLEVSSGGEWIAVDPRNVTDTSRCTRLGEISTIEHLFSALAGSEVTDVQILVEGGELPGLDGSAKLYFDAISEAGLTTVGQLSIEGPFARVFDKRDECVVAVASGDGHWRYSFETEERWPGLQEFEYVHSREAFGREVAGARTFCFEEELEMIKAHGLGKGLDESSALVLGQTGYLNASRFADEPARHKLLDLIGDLYLTGIPLAALNVTAARSGHTANVRMAARLMEHIKIERSG